MSEPTARPPLPEGGGVDLEQGLPMVSADDPERLAEEKTHLADLARKPLLVRWAGYARMTGPGWLQSAMTLGGGSAAASLTIGALFGYQLLWVQPIAMVLGVIMLSAMSYQTLSTRARPFGVMKRFVHPSVAWAWALATLVATVIWHFPQYALAAGMVDDMVKTGTGWAPTGGAHTAFMLVVGVVILIGSTLITWNYASGWKGIRLYERALKAMVWVIIVSFAVVIARAAFAGKIPVGDLLLGFVPRPSSIPTDTVGIGTVLAAFGAAVGINMTFMFPYTQLARGWGKEHRGVARFDLVTGMLLPFVVATSLMTIAAACTIHGSVEVQGRVSPVDAARMIAGAGVGETVGHFIFGLGILGMVLSSITTHMIVAGFAACEMFHIEPKGWQYKLTCMIPAVGFLGVVLWKYMGMWVAVWTSAVCGAMLPIAYIAFFVLHNRRDYLGADMPRGARRWAWNIGMGLAILATLAYLVYAAQGEYAAGIRKFFALLAGD
ncbi:MAG: divalent metal cation transporter [Phycisphaerae bacterium]|nr:divalent metal cation transporter [Phycisphaerae bacterium]